MKYTSSRLRLGHFCFGHWCLFRISCFASEFGFQSCSEVICRPVLGRRLATKYQDYTRLARHAADLVEQQDYQGALATLQGLVASEISDKDKAMMCFNVAIVYDKLGRTDDALAWYGKGADYERRAGTIFVAERWAAYLAEQGRDLESMVRYQELLGHPSLAEDDRERIGKNIEVLLRRVT